MSGAQASLAISVFLASAVEATEAFTIVLAVGSARDWRSSLLGVGAATVVLAALIAILGPALTLIPLDALRLVVGGLLLIFGLQWLRKAILRAGGVIATHDEKLAFERETAAARAAPRERGLDHYALLVSFKGVLLEGLEVAFIVLTFGANQHDVPLAAAAGALAVVVVLGAGAALRAPLASVPENSMKFIVGIALSTFGVFWGAEGAGASWPGDDAALPVLALALLAASWLMVRSLRRAGSSPAVETA
ncbi:MAG TPA: hypothetical protein VH476_07575 [Solirubrobacterales bacterium]